MMQKDQPVNQEVNTDPKPSKPARMSTGSVSVTGFVKIFDPKTKETFVETQSMISPGLVKIQGFVTNI
jgi:hypothetical protein